MLVASLRRTPALVVMLLAAACAPSGPAPAAGGPIGNVEVEGVPPIPPALRRSAEAYQNSRAAMFLGWLSDGILIRTRFAGTEQLHRVASPLGAREQLTFGSEPVSSASVSPAGLGGFLYVSDVGGSEDYQVFWVDGADGSTKLLSDGTSRYTNIVWSPSGSRFAYTTTERNGVDWDLHVRSLADEQARVVQQGEGVGWSVADWSPDESRLLLLRFVSTRESHLYELDLDTGERRELLDPTLVADIDRARYGDAGTVYFASDLGSEFIRLMRLDLTTGRFDSLTSEIPWNVESFALDRARATIAYTVNEDGWSRLAMARLPDMAFVALPNLPRGIYDRLEFSPDGSALGFSVESATSPEDVYSVDLASKTLDRWTRSELGGLVSDDLVAPELVRYPTFDEREIPAFVYKPSGPGPHPVLVNIHGGPASQHRPRFSPTTQFYTGELGLAVVAPNVRGSRGYGKTYISLDDGYQREDAVRDIGALLDWIDAQPDLDGSRVAVAGGSYGGYMVLASLVHFGDRLRAGVDRVGISNFVTFLENTRGYRVDLRRVEYGDERDPQMRAFLQSIAPRNRVDEIRRPLLVSQGLNDPRVPASESQQMVRALASQGVPVWYVLALNEGHSFRKKANRDYLLHATALFLRRYLLGES